MGEHELMLVRLVNILDQVARPHGCDEALPIEVQAGLWQLGFPCNEQTPREELIPQLWARKRFLLMGIGHGWRGPGITPPTAA